MNIKELKDEIEEMRKIYNFLDEISTISIRTPEYDPRIGGRIRIETNHGETRIVLEKEIG